MRRLGVAYCVREGNFARPVLLLFVVCHSLLIEMRRLAASFSCHHAALVDAGIIVCDCCMVVQYIHTYRPTHPSHSQIHRHYLYLDRARLRKTHGLSLYLFTPGPHGSVGAASTRALDHIPECSSMIGLPFRHPGTLLSNHAIYSSPCIHFLLT